jgi:hypothetical protein
LKRVRQVAVACDERGALDLSLRDQHPVERIGMMRGECHELLGVPECHREFAKLARLDHRGERVGQPQLPEPLLDRDLPSGYGADPYEISGGNGFAALNARILRQLAACLRIVGVVDDFRGKQGWGSGPS